MARGKRKTIDEKIAVKQELIQALLTRIEAEKHELMDLQEEKKRKELEVVGDLIAEAGLEPDEVAQLLQDYKNNRRDVLENQQEFEDDCESAAS